MGAWTQSAVSFLGSLLGVVGGVAIARLTVRGNDRATNQRELAARREEWGRRFIWAAELVLDESAIKRTIGLNILAKLALSDLAGRDEYLLLDSFQKPILERLFADQQGRKDGPQPTAETIAAARLRLVLDGKLGHETPSFIRDMSLTVASARKYAGRMNRVQHILQAAVVVGSLAVTGMIGFQTPTHALHWAAFVISWLVGTAAGCQGYFRYRERAFSLASTADAIENDLRGRAGGSGTDDPLPTSTPR